MAFKHLTVYIDKKKKSGLFIFWWEDKVFLKVHGKTKTMGNT